MNLHTGETNAIAKFAHTISKRITRVGKKVLPAVVSVAAVFSLTACGTPAAPQSQGASNNNKVVNIGVSNVLASANPLLLDNSLMATAVVGLSYLSLFNIDRDFNFVPELATSVDTSDNKNFTIKLDPKAVWSDGKPITADDVLYTVLKLASPTIANTSTGFSTLAGTGDDGYVAKDATSVEGVKKIDEHTVNFTTKEPLALTLFQKTYGLLHPVPKHVLQKYSDDELVKTTLFNNPSVISGPYRLTKVDLKHLIQFKANDKYYKGAPKIANLNFKILKPAQILSGLQSGELDVVPQTLAGLLLEDYPAVKALKKVTAVPSKRITHEMLFFNTKRVTSTKLRKAFLYGIDREKVRKGFAGDNAEVYDGFLTAGTQIYDKNIKPTPYDKNKAKQLVEEAKAEGWDSSKPLEYYISNSDNVMSKAADFIAAELKQIGINIQVKSVDLSTLLSHAGKQDFDLLSVQYTFFPPNPGSYIAYLLKDKGWTGYSNPAVTSALDTINRSKDQGEIKKQFGIIERVVQKDVPAFNLFTIGSLGGVNKRVKNVHIDAFGTFLNVNDWDIQ